MEADILCQLDIIWLLGDYHKWFDVIRREVILAKLDAVGVPSEYSRLVAAIYADQKCRHATFCGVSTGRVRGPAGLAQGLPGSTLWSLLAQDPAWVMIANELHRPGGAAEAYGIRAPPRGWSDDHIFALANEAGLRDLLAVFGAACEDLGISCKPEALRLYLRRKLDSGETPPTLRAWNPQSGAFTSYTATILEDTVPTRQLGVPRGPRAGSTEYRRRIQDKLDIGMASLQGLHLTWDELGLAARALLGGAANFAPLDSELPLPWLHQLDDRLADMARRTLHLGRASRLHFTLPPAQGGLDLPSAVVEFGLVPWARELIVELNDATSWGALARNMLDHEIAAVQTGVRSPAHVAERLRSTHIVRLAGALAGYGFSYETSHTKHTAEPWTCWQSDSYKAAGFPPDIKDRASTTAQLNQHNRGMHNAMRRGRPSPWGPPSTLLCWHASPACDHTDLGTPSTTTAPPRNRGGTYCLKYSRRSLTCQPAPDKPAPHVH